MLVPIDMSYVEKLPFYEREIVLKADFNKFSALAPIISNITLPWRVKDNQGMSEIIKSIIPYPEYNIFNCISDIPFIKMN